MLTLQKINSNELIETFAQIIEIIETKYGTLFKINIEGQMFYKFESALNN